MDKRNCRCTAVSLGAKGVLSDSPGVVLTPVVGLQVEVHQWLWANRAPLVLSQRAARPPGCGRCPSPPHLPSGPAPWRGQCSPVRRRSSTRKHQELGDSVTCPMQIARPKISGIKEREKFLFKWGWRFSLLHGIGCYYLLIESGKKSPDTCSRFLQETGKVLAPLNKFDGTRGDKNEVLLWLHLASFTSTWQVWGTSVVT